MPRGKIFFVLPVIFPVCALSACGPGSGEGLDNNGQPLNESVVVSPSPYRQIQDKVFTAICTQCHTGAGVQGLALDDGVSYGNLVGVPSTEVPALKRVVPGDPGASYLVQKIEGTADVGSRMPLGQAPLDPALIALIRDWIAGGAPPP